RRAPWAAGARLFHLGESAADRVRDSPEARARWRALRRDRLQGPARSSEAGEAPEPARARRLQARRVAPRTPRGATRGARGSLRRRLGVRFADLLALCRPARGAARAGPARARAAAHPRGPPADRRDPRPPGARREGRAGGADLHQPRAPLAPGG